MNTSQHDMMEGQSASQVEMSSDALSTYNCLITAGVVNIDLENRSIEEGNFILLKVNPNGKTVRVISVSGSAKEGEFTC